MLDTELTTSQFVALAAAVSFVVGVGIGVLAFGDSHGEATMRAVLVSAGVAVGAFVGRRSDTDSVAS